MALTKSQAVPPAVVALWGANLRAARLRAGYVSQAELARAIGCTRGAVSLWENGLRAPTYESRCAIARTLRRNPTRLFPEAA
jgi:transcriptional regulator with XRE-family HTH domain